jgi:hypothetical protein
VTTIGENVGKRIYRVSKEEMSIFWEVIVSVNLSKKLYRVVKNDCRGF